MPRNWISIPVWHGIRIGRSISDAEWRGHLPSWRRHELRHGLQTAAKARGEILTREDADYLIDKALATGAIDANGNLNFHGRGTKEEIIDSMMATTKAWGSPLTRADAMRVVSREITWHHRVQHFVLSAMLGLIKIIAALALCIAILSRVFMLIRR
jgi:hypothetical protein